MIRYRLGPAVIEIQAETPPRLNPIYDLFQHSGHERPDLLIQVRSDSPSSVKGALECEVTNHWKLFKAENGFYLEVYDQKDFRVKQLIFINSKWGQADFFFFSEDKNLGRFFQGEWQVGEFFTPFVQWWLTSWLAFQKNGMIVHSSAVSFSDLALAFVGPSGAGKTTIARWCRDIGGKTVLNDERIILWKDQDDWYVSGTPWPGMLFEAAPMTRPLAGVCILNKATLNQFIAWNPKKVLTHLLPEAFFPIWDFGRTDGLVETASRLTQEVPGGELSFRNDASILNYLDELISSLRGAPKERRSNLKSEIASASFGMPPRNDVR